MTSRMAGTRDQNQDQNQNAKTNHIRTRSQLPLPELNVDYDRSPLKNAREALRRANARFGQLNGSRAGSSNTGSDGDVDTKMEEILARSKSGSTSNPFRRAAVENVNDILKVMKTDEPTTEPTTAMTTDNKESMRTTLQRRPSNPFDLITEMVDDHPKHPKRPRSSSFDEPRPPSPSGSDAKAGGSVTCDRPSSKSPLLPSHGLNSNGLAAESGVSSSEPESASIASSETNTKRAKLGGQVTLDAFFPRPSSQSKSAVSKPAQPSNTVTRRIFSGTASSSFQFDSSSSTPVQNPKLTIGEQASVFPKTPTVKELQAIRTLDLRTVTPSPKKRALQIGLGTPGAKMPMKARAFSAGATLALDHSDAIKEDETTTTAERKERNKRAASEPCEEDGTATQPLLQASPKVLSPSRRPLLLPESKVEVRSMDIDENPADLEKVETENAPVTDQVLPTITVSTSTSTVVVSSVSDDAIQRSSLPKPAPADVDPTPSTPRDKVLPSRPFPSNRLPSTKSHLSKFLSMSPLTPLSALSPTPRLGSDEHDYEEEERFVQEGDMRMADREAAKKAMQEEGEPQGDADVPTPTTAALFPLAPPVEPSPTPSGPTRKASNKSKQKGKALSSTSRIATGVTGMKRRKSLIPSTPHLRLTRASVLRQKAIQAQMRTPKDKGRRSSILPPKNANALAGKCDDGQKDKGTSKESSEQDGTLNDREKRKKAETEPQRSPRKTFVLTVPSSLSPRKTNSTSSSTSSSANSSVTLKPTPLESAPSKLFTFSLYPPSLNDTAATEQAQQALNKLSSALDKLSMPPPSKPNSSASRPGGELKRPASEQRERIRPATSLGFTRENSVPVSGAASRGNGRPRATSRAGSVEPAKRFLPPPPPPAFGSSLIKERAKMRTLAHAPRTAPTAFGTNGGNPPGHGHMPPPSSFHFGLGSGGVFGRPIPRMRASQKTSLETVQGSPVKGGTKSQEFNENEEDEIMIADGPSEQGDAGADADASASSSNANGDTSISSTEGDTPINGAMSASGKELKRISKLNASRRASMAFSTLAQSLGTSPDGLSPFTPKDSNANDDVMEERTPTEASAFDNKVITNAISSSRPVRAAAPRSFGFGAPGLHRSQSESAAHTGARARSVTPFSESDGEGPGRSSTKKSSGSMGRTKMPGSLDILDQCTVFVDVRTEEGEDAGALFVDMLRGLGAKVLTRVGQTCTHIVYKNGLSSTVTRYRLLDEPRPKVVGIGWVVECAEKRARVDESRFQVDLESVNVAGTLKRRRSFLPKQILPSYASGPMDAFLSGSTSGSDTATVVDPVPKACADSDVTSEDGDTSQERILSGSSLGSNIHPLVRARRRSIMIPR
ncbi:hypothetical protein ACEPAI_8510 [Sanghuangporus weigelae]